MLLVVAALDGYEWLNERDTDRLHVPDPPQDPLDPRSPFERDRSRIIHSVAFRRLQGKTQIFAAGWADFVRTRVTHSIEVSQIGRALAQRFSVPEALVEAACLGHDLGHPPFGHTGEKILDHLMDGIGHFEGNAQSFRMVTRLEAKARDYEGLDLCRASLLSIIKYPYWLEAGTGKFLYDDDAAFYAEWLFENSGRALLKERSDDPPRTLPCELMDWADDIAYSVHDLEDGIVSGFLVPALWTEDEIIDAVYASVASAPIKWREGPPDRDAVGAILEALAGDFGTYAVDIPRDVIREFTRARINEFATAGDVVATGPDETLFDYTLEIPEEIRIKNQVMKAITFELVINDPRTTTLALKGTEVLRRLFETLVDNALGPAPGSGVNRYLLFDRRERRDLASLGDDDALIGRYVCDYLASMTEGQAMALYERLFEPMAGFSAT